MLAVKMGRGNRSDDYDGSTEARIETFVRKMLVSVNLIPVIFPIPQKEKH